MDQVQQEDPGSEHGLQVRLSVVIPVYKGEASLATVVEELMPYTRSMVTKHGHPYTVEEIILVHDCGPDRSDLVIERLVQTHPAVKSIWLSRNFGQHAATMAGMASSSGDWVVTMDEDGQQDPCFLPAMLDTALGSSFQVVYAQATNTPPHGWFRNGLSALAKAVAGRLLPASKSIKFNSFRLVDGEIARTLAAYCSHGVYLDVGLFWIAGVAGSCPVTLRSEIGRSSGYSYVKLVMHFWSMVVSTGTRPLRIITLVGFLSMLLSILIALYALYGKLFIGTAVPGWTSLLVVVSFFSGSTMTALGVIAEYLAMTMGIVMGKPLYVIASKPNRGGRVP